MYTTTRYILSVVILLPTLAIASESSNSNKQGYNLGAFPYLSSYQMIEAYGPVAKQLGQELGKPVRLRSAANFVKFAQNLESEIYDIAVIQPFDYPNATEKYHYYPLVRVDEPLITTFVVREDSPLKSLSDLKGKKLAFPPKPSANARMARAELNKLGLHAATDFTITYHNSHDSCMHDVLIGRAATCPSGGAAITLFEEKRHVKFKVLATTPAIPHVSIVAHSRVPQQEREFLQHWFSTLNDSSAGQKILQGLHFPGFVIATDDDYKILNNYVESPNIVTANHQAEIAGGKSNSDHVLTLGIFPYVTPKQLAKLIAPIPQDLSKVLGDKEVRFKTTSSFSKFVDNIEQASYDIVLVQPFDVEGAIKAGYIPLAQMSQQIKTAIYTKQSNNIRSIGDLKNKTIAAPPRQSAVSRILLAEFEANGLRVGRDVKITYRRSHYACLEQLQHGFVDACATAPQIVDNMIESSLKKEIYKVYESISVPGAMFLAKNNIPKEQLNKLQYAMINWKSNKDGQKLLKQAGFSGFMPANISQYQNLTSQFR